MSLPALDDATLEDLYRWLDRIPFSRDCKNLGRDFSDGLLLAELIHNFLPRIVDLHNYTAATTSVQKRYNWTALNKRVLAKLGCQLPNNVIQHVISCKPGAIEFVLLNIRMKIDLALCQKDFMLNVPRKRSTTSSTGSLNSSLENLAASVIPDGSVINAPKSYLAHSATNTPRMARRNFSMSARKVEKVSPGGGAEELVPARHLYDARAKLLAKEEQVQVLEARVNHLERLSDLKDERIGDLTGRLERLSQELFHQHNLHWTGMLNNHHGGAQSQTGEQTPEPNTA